MSLSFQNWQNSSPTRIEKYFDELAIYYFKNQSKSNLVYKKYLKNLNFDVSRVRKPSEIPFLPLTLYKNHTIKTGKWLPEVVFKSSGTTALIPSSNPCRSLKDYHQNAKTIFEHFYGAIDNYHFLALLPNYLEKGDSSLVSMVASFIDQSKSTQSGFFLNNYDELVRRWKDLLASDERKVIVLGVSFALLDLAEQFPFDARGSIVMETGGMKGRRKEMIRAELHKKFMDAWKLATIHSEYGMTELSSQAYSSGRGIFKCRPGMKFVLRDITDPFASVPKGTIGKICIIDLANKDTCCFLETSDLGREVSDGYFEILGREDGSESRGCNLMVF